MTKKLVVLAGPDEGRVFSLGNEVVLLGRSRATDTHLMDPHVSRVHCQVLAENGKYVLVDFDSAGGTFVNGKQVSRHDLQSGDLIRIGTTHLQFVEDQGAAVATAAPAQATAAGKAKAKVKTTRPGAWTESLVGQVFTHYKIGQPFARSHTGFVFHASDTRRNLPLALKVLDPRYTKDEKKVKKFVAAMKAVLPLRHPNLVRVYSAGRTGDHLWVAMEYIKAGESLAAVIGRSAHAGRSDWRVVVRLGIYLARALDYAHQKKIIHQNVAPQNIILGRQIKDTKLADLMLASALYEDPTLPISAAGTPSEALPYMSPERTDGAEAMVDGRTDVYSLAATLFALLAGHPPFQAATAPELIAKIRLEAPPTLRAVHVEAPEPVDHILRQALAKRPQDRQESARQFVRGLEAVAKAQEITV
jgi:serine/threonine protein kinase